jgi:predicted DNA-binding protein
MFEVPLSDEAVAVLNEIAKKVGKSPEEFARRAILDVMEDTEDALLAEERLRTSEGTLSLEEVMAKHSDLTPAQK